MMLGWSSNLQMLLSYTAAVKKRESLITLTATWVEVAWSMASQTVAYAPTPSLEMHVNVGLAAW